jgi:hypothetical protein
LTTYLGNMKRFTFLVLAAALVLPVITSTSFAQGRGAAKERTVRGGLQVGLANEYLSVWGATPVLQQSGTQDMRVALQNFGVIASGSSNTPLNLNAGLLQVGNILVSGTSYGGVISNANWVNPVVSGSTTLSGTIYGGATRIGTITGGTFAGPTISTPAISGGTVTASTIAAPVLSGTATGTLVSGTFSGSTLSTPAITAPVLSGTASGALVASGTTTVTGALVISTGTASAQPAGAIAVSGTQIFVSTGSTWIAQ